MADLTKTTPPGGNADAGVAITFTAATTTDQEAAFSSGDYLIAWNSGASPRTVTVYSAPAPRSGRLNDITAEAIAAGAHRIYGPFDRAGWRQANGKLKFKASHADVQFAVVTRVTP